jgi:hypothetical protein
VARALAGFTPPVLAYKRMQEPALVQALENEIRAWVATLSTDPKRCVWTR